MAKKVKTKKKVSVSGKKLLMKKTPKWNSAFTRRTLLGTPAKVPPKGSLYYGGLRVIALGDLMNAYGYTCPGGSVQTGPSSCSPT